MNVLQLSKKKPLRFHMLLVGFGSNMYYLLVKSCAWAYLPGEKLVYYLWYKTGWFV